MQEKRKKLNGSGRLMVVREYTARMLMLILLLASSGDPYWRRAWIFFFFTVAANIIFHLFVVLPYPELYNERGRPGDNVKPWDRKVMFYYAVAGYLSMVFMGLDHRFGWSHLGESWIWIGGLIIAFSFFMSAWAMRVNHFFSSFVRIQDDRGQVVCDRGPYSVVRHPGYVGAILFYFGSPLMLGSPLGLIFAFIILGIFVYRIVREEEALTSELSGYREYKQRVTYRLIPGIW